jgi:hypothetical protein
MPDIHGILFNAHIMFAVVIGIWAAVMVARGEAVDGGFWGSVAIYTVLVGVTTLVGVIMVILDFRPADGELSSYFIYMAFLVAAMPGMFAILRGRNDSVAAIVFSVLAFFNAGTAMSMATRGLVYGWMEIS